MKKLFGWLAPYARTPEQQSLHEEIVGGWDAFHLDYSAKSGTDPERLVFWDAEKLLLGNWLPNTPQQIGDCVSWGCKHVVDRLSIFEIIRLGQNEEFHASFAPYFYGISRCQIGGNRIGGDGSMGSWAAEGVKKYGVLRADAEGCPTYSGSIARQWGGRSGPPDKFIEIAKPHLIRSAARITSAEELKQAICNGYPCTIASMRGFAMRLKDRDGKSWFVGRDTWPHQMWIAGYDSKPQPCFYRGNNWGPDAHGPQLDGPPGGGWQTFEELDRELRDSGVECYAFSQFDGFPGQKLDFSAF